MRFFVILTFMIIPLLGRSQNWDKAYVDSIFDGRVLSPIEGIWQFPKDDAKIAIVKSTSDTYDIYLLDSPRLDIKPGLNIGTATASPKSNVFDGSLNSGKIGKKHKLKSESVTFTVNDGGTLTIEPYKTGYTVSFRRLWYRIFGISLVDNTNNRPKGLDGARRIYPYIMTDHLPICL